MLPIFIGDVTLLLGFALLLLPLLVTELSRPRDPLWGGVVLLLGLALVTSHDRLSGASVLALSSGTLVTTRLGCEVAQSRWQQLSSDEKLRLGSLERWRTGIKQFAETLFGSGGMLSGLMKIVISKPSLKTKKKKWVRPENEQDSQSSNQAVTASEETRKSSADDLQDQPKETLERQSPPDDS